MKQVWITKTGSPEVLRVVDVAMPEPRAGEVRIRVAAAGVNFADIMGRLGLYPDAPRPPYVPGYEVAGTVEAVGAGVDPAVIGSEVMALTRFGGYSEAVCVPQSQIIPRPADLPVEVAAGFLVPYLTAYGSLVALAGIKPGEQVLIQAAGGGVGLAAVDIAAIFGATIYGTASPAKHEVLRARGVHYPLPYRHFEREVRRLSGGCGVQIALDSVGGRSWLKSYRALSAGGRLVICGVFSLAPRQHRSLLAALKFALGVPWLRFNPVALANDNKGVLGLNIGRLWNEQPRVRVWLDQVMRWQQEGRLHPHLDRVFPLAEAAAAHRYLQERRNIGKVVLVP